MIIVKICGGLGNQMFQYAMARSVATRHNTEVKLDLSWFADTGTTTGRIFDLQRLNITINEATHDEVSRLLKLRKQLGRDLYGILIPFRWKKYLKMKEFRPFDERYLNVGSDVYLEGYWTDERYFADVSSLVKKELTLRGTLSTKNQQIAENIRKTLNSISIHVRRGDYVQDETTRSIFHLCNEDYYARAVAEVKKRIKDPVFFVFSDDIEWVKKHIAIGAETRYVSDSGEGLPHEELMLMSMCRHNIIANSTFSWWAAWLNPNSDKVVIAPDRWYNLEEYSGAECVPAGWVKIPVS